MGILPGGASDVDTTNGFMLVSAAGTSDLSITDLPGQDETTVRAAYADKYVNNGHSVLSDPTSPLGQVFGGLAGLPGLLAALVGKLFNVDLSHLTDVGSVIDTIEQVPGVTQLIAEIKALTNVDLGTIFDGVDLTQPGAVVTAIENAIAGLVGGLIQRIIDGFAQVLNGSQATGNDPSALLGLLNPITQLNNLQTFIETLGNQLSAQIAGLDGRVAAQEAISTTGQTGGSDDFNRATLGGNWTNVSGTLAITASQYVQTGALAAAYYNTSPLTDKQGITIKVVAKIAGRVRGFICSDTTMSNYVAVEVCSDFFGNDYIRLVTGSSPSFVVSQTQVNYLGYQLRNDTVVSLRYNPTTNTYTVLVNGTVVDGLTWVDSANVITHGGPKRICGVVTNCDNSAFTYGWGITDYTFYDWT